MTSREQHVAIYHPLTGKCECPDDWPKDIGPTSCLPCYMDPKTGGIDRPADMCTDHVRMSSTTRQQGLTTTGEPT